MMMEQLQEFEPMASLPYPLDPLDMTAELTAVLKAWRRIKDEQAETQRAFLQNHGVTITNKMIEGSKRLLDEATASTKRFIGYFDQDNSHLSARELAYIAERVSPGGAHDGGLLVELIREGLWTADPILVAATIYSNWHGGKRGFQFLPDPAVLEISEYATYVEELLGLFDEATDRDPRRILIGDDLAFFDALPERFTVYRGCSGLSASQAEAGICWTVRREVAEWFAWRHADGNAKPVLLSARVQKADVRLVNAVESEVVVKPWKCRELQISNRFRDLKRRNFPKAI